MLFVIVLYGVNYKNKNYLWRLVKIILVLNGSRLGFMSMSDNILQIRNYKIKFGDDCVLY
ncbi:hypothetical protein EDC55_101123 [Allofrancisella inopinata]|nr:hypothetical protein EDC55_101123 [Allofrancisella inopinata]